MTEAIQQARSALDAGEFPVGCVITLDNTIVATGARIHTTRHATNETDHAEITALRTFSADYPDSNRDKAVLYCTLEPCLMCFAAIILAGISTIVYAYEDAMGGGTGCDLSSLPPLYSRARPKIVSGILRDKSLSLFKQFFENPDNRYWKDSYLEKYTLEAI